MKDFSGKIAVITGGGTGMGRELARQLTAEGAHVAMCDVSAANMERTVTLCKEAGLPQGVRITAHVADVAVEDNINNFAREIAEQHETDKIHLLFNNAGVGGGGSFVTDSRASWERTFNICWGGVYYGCRAFLPMLMKADEGHIINTSSVNGFWASLGPATAHTAYSAAKFAVKGFTEALVNDLRLNAPHLKCSVVMPGHIGTAIAGNSRKVLMGTESNILSPDEIAASRARMTRMGVDAASMSDEQIQAGSDMMAKAFEENAPTSAAQAAAIILQGVRDERWRILVGDDAHRMDEMVRARPEEAYEQSFFQDLSQGVGWQLGGGLARR